MTALSLSFILVQGSSCMSNGCLFVKAIGCKVWFKQMPSRSNPNRNTHIRICTMQTPRQRVLISVAIHKAKVDNANLKESDDRCRGSSARLIDSSSMYATRYSVSSWPCHGSSTVQTCAIGDGEKCRQAAVQQWLNVP